MTSLLAATQHDPRQSLKHAVIADDQVTPADHAAGSSVYHDGEAKGPEPISLLLTGLLGSGWSA